MQCLHRNDNKTIISCHYVYLANLKGVHLLQTDSRHSERLYHKVIEKCTNFYFGTEKLPPKF